MTIGTRCPKCGGFLENTTCMGTECMECGFVKKLLSLPSIPIQPRHVRGRKSSLRKHSPEGIPAPHARKLPQTPGEEIEN